MNEDQRPPTIEWHGPSSWKKDKPYAEPRHIWFTLSTIVASVIIGIFIGVNI